MEVLWLMENGKRARRRRAVAVALAGLLAALAAFGVLPAALVSPLSDAAGAVAGEL